MFPADNMIGQRFGWLIVDGVSSRRTTGGNAYWRCSCRCGRTIEVIGQNLRSGNTVSCGCLRSLMPAAQRLLEEYRRLEPEWTEEQYHEWEQARLAEEHGELILALTFGHLLHGVPLQAMGFPGRYPHVSGGVGGKIEPSDPRDWDNAERRKRDPQRADIVYDGDNDSP